MSVQPELRTMFENWCSGFSGVFPLAKDGCGDYLSVLTGNVWVIVQKAYDLKAEPSATIGEDTQFTGRRGEPGWEQNTAMASSQGDECSGPSLSNERPVSPIAGEGQKVTDVKSDGICISDIAGEGAHDEDDAHISCRAVASSLAAQLEEAKRKLAKCGGENCMGHAIEGCRSWVSKERLEKEQAEVVQLTAQLEVAKWHFCGMVYWKDRAEKAEASLSQVREELAHAVLCMDRNCKRCKSLVDSKGELEKGRSQ
jgi:hypothetical protein